MIDLHKHLLAFNEKIKLSDSQVKQLKAQNEKIRLVIYELLIAEKIRGMILLKTFEQGSQYMDTAIKPYKVSGDYDVDMGLLFRLENPNTSPAEIKKTLRNLLEKGRRKIVYKKPCMRIEYTNYHIDLAIYSESIDGTDTYRLARGYEKCKKEEHKWEKAQPSHLQQWFDNSFSEAKDKEQIKRIIRYLKRWKDVNFKEDKGKPTGIALTVCVCKWFNTYQGQQNDLNSLIELINIMQNELFPFTYLGKAKLLLPVEPKNNLFEKINAERKYLTEFKAQLNRLFKVLLEVQHCNNEQVACQLLASVFGKDFPVIKSK